MQRRCAVALHADEDGCAAPGASNACAAQSLICRDVPLPGTGYKCVCPVGTGPYGSSCDVCVKVVAGGVNLTGPPYETGVPATQAQIAHPMDVSVDSAGNLYIAGKFDLIFNQLQYII
jgi:hypothetical protein